MLHAPGAMIPPSTPLMVIWYSDNRLNTKLNLTTMHIARKSHLQMFVWQMPHISIAEGSLCSNQSKSELEYVLLNGINSDNTNMSETLPANVFAHCVSLNIIVIIHTGLTYLPDRVFSTNVSHLETLLLTFNKLTSNISWSDVLRPLHELKSLDLSGNMLTSWTYNLSSLWSLERLYLSHNAITKISHVAFMNMTRLKFLSLENNNIASVAPKVQHAFAHISLLNLRSNNIHKLNMLNETMLSNTIILDMSANNLMELGMPLERKCSSCGKISLFGDNNKLLQFVLPCSNTHQYATVSLTYNKLTDINSIFPNVSLQQCSIETLNVSGNHFRRWSIKHTLQNTQIQFALNRMNLGKEPKTHDITTLDMTHCGVEVINPLAFFIFNIQFLDLRENAIRDIPTMFPHSPYPSVLDAHSNPIMCNCKMLWVKQHLNHNTFKVGNEIQVSSCMEPVWNTSMDIVTVPDIMFMCETKCPMQIHDQCNNATRCYRTDSDTDLDAIVCLSSHNDSKLSSAFITVLYQLHISGFNLATLKLPYVKPHSLTHLNLTSCNISVIPKTTFINTPRLELLVLAHNAIQTISSTVLYPLVGLKHLDLPNNQLLFFDAEMILPLFLLQTVYLHENKLKQLSLETLEEFKMLNNQSLSLHDNPWICECNDTFRHWIVEQLSIGILLNPENVMCAGIDIPVMLSNVTCTTHMKIHVHLGSKAATLVSSVLGSISIVALVVCILIYKYRSRLSVLAYIYMPQCTRKRTENDDIRGVFAICDDKEMGAREWIRQSLLPFIECACPLLWSQLTFAIGEDMAVNIQHSVEQTNCAIVLLSRRFLQNEWSCCMFQAAFNEMRQRKRRYKIILILTPDVTVNMLTSDENCPQALRDMLKTQRLVYMTKKFYYETLLYLLPDSCRSTRQIMTVRGENIITTVYEQHLTPNMWKILPNNVPVIM